MDWKSEEGRALLAQAYPNDSAMWDPDERDSATFAVLKLDLSAALGWPWLPNLSWFQVWPGGWCLLGRPSGIKMQSAQKSINFELPPEVLDAAVALVLAKAKVMLNPDRLKEQVRWYCPEHSWEEIVKRGEMHSGCPQCGGYYCEPYPKPGEGEE